jgi:single-strand DNA-binding protein
LSRIAIVGSKEIIQHNSKNIIDYSIKINFKKQSNMNNLRNRVQIIGHLGANPEIKELENGNKMAKLTIATNESYKNQKGEVVKETQWHNIVVWGNNVKVVEQYLQKGNEVCIEGKLNNRDYTDKDGIKRYITEIVCQELLLLGSKK